jgi:hypothetical protein
MSSREWNELNKIVKAAAKAIDDNEQFFLEGLASKASNVAQANPVDQTAIGMSGFLNKRASSGDIFISRSELREIYSKLFTPNNKFARNFSAELGIAAESAEVNKMTRDPNEGESLVEYASNKFGNPLLSKELKSAFDKNIPYQPFSDEMGDKAKKACVFELNCQGVLPKRVDVVAGKDNFIICQATYETPSGESNVLVPTEIKNGTALMPSMFLSKEGYVNISKENIKQHIISTAGKLFKVNVTEMLDNLLTVTGELPSPLTELEKLIMKSAALKQGNHNINPVLYQEVDTESPNVEVPVVAQSEEVKTFAEMLTSKAGEAEFIFGKEAVRKGRDFVKFVVSNCGYKDPQVAVKDSSKDSIFYAVSIGGRKGFNVPVKVANNTLEEPKIAIACGNIHPLTSKGLNDLLSSDTDQSSVAMASPCYDLKPSELVDRIRTSMLDKKYKQAEEALHTLKHTGNSKAFTVGYTIFMEGLKGKLTKSAALESKCTAPVKNSTSQHLICSHTNLPLHKVYQDKYGDCHPLYRKGQKENAEPVSFLHSKICWD